MAESIDAFTELTRVRRGVDGLADRLDRIERHLATTVALMRIAYLSEIDRAEREIVAEPVAAALLRFSQDWISAGELKKRVAKETGISEATIKRRAAELASRGALERRGAGPRVGYRATELFEV
ncbi:MAG TPA: hypothetical protein VN458_00145 [Solirubrobacterales bacterium]|nr:hypothetical protein [Solirubrobacterales bacterium]